MVFLIVKISAYAVNKKLTYLVICYITNSMDTIKELIKKAKLDLSITGNARWMDQKVTPDILQLICEIVYITRSPEQGFTVNQVLYSTEFLATVKESFGKEPNSSKNFKSEVGKIVMQPLKLLASAGILEETTEDGNRAIIFKIKNYEVLGWIADEVLNSYKFLSAYFEEFLIQNSMEFKFEELVTQLKNGQDNSLKSFEEFRDSFTKRVNEFTNSKKAKEPRRVFNKVYNLLAYSNGVNGVEVGELTAEPCSYDSLMYNRENIVHKGIRHRSASLDFKALRAKRRMNDLKAKHSSGEIELDKPTVVKTRTEQSLLRENLFTGKTATCSFCNKEYPSDLMAAAHIKKRSECSDVEKLDHENIVVKACRVGVGCDLLFEKGIIGVNTKTKKVELNVDKVETDDLMESVKILSGNKFTALMTGNIGYLDWHYHNVFKKPKL